MKKIKLVEEFKAFISKGNVVDMAVGVVVGGAFGKIVTSLVSDLIMPLVGLITGGGSLKDMFVVLGDRTGFDPAKYTTPATRGRGRIRHAQLRQLHSDCSRFSDNCARNFPRHKAHGDGKIEAHPRKSRRARSRDHESLSVLLH